MNALHIGVALAVALLAQTTLGPLLPSVGPPIDLVLVVVVLAALSGGPVVGLWTGTVGGLLQDALSGGIVGVGGLTKTLVGVAIGILGTQFIVGSVWPRMAIVLVASGLHAFGYLGVYVLVGVPGPAAPTVEIIVQAVANALVAGLAEGMVRVAPGLGDRARRGRGSVRPRRWMVT